VDGRGVPLSLVVTAANRNDVTELATLLAGRVVTPVADGASVTPRQHLCADAGYAGKPADAVIRAAGFIPHVRSRSHEKSEREEHPDYRPRRWVVEVSHSWFTRFRKLLVRFEKTWLSFIALHQLAAAIIAFRRNTYLYGPY
jgi:transposase